MNTKKTKQTIILPTPEGQVDYRQRLIHNILAKFLGNTTVISKGNELHFIATEAQTTKIQSLVDACSDELDDLIETFLYSYLLRKGMKAPKEIVLTIKEVA